MDCAKKVLAMLKGGGNRRFWGKSLSHTKMGSQRFPSFKGGREWKGYPVLRGEMKTVLDPQFSHFVAPPPFQIINDHP